MIVFLHIPKTGGTTVTRRMETVYGSRMASLLGDPEAAQVEDWSQYAAAAGHFTPLIERWMPSDLRYFTVVRNPVNRILSLYRWWHEHDTAPIAEWIRAVQGMSFREFVEHPDYEVSTVNGQVKQLSFRPEYAEDTDFDRAVEMLDRCELVGITAQLDAYLDAMGNHLGWPASAAIQRHKRTDGGTETVDRDTLRYILSRNAEDMALFEYARRIAPGGK